ncbi:MAG: hypothetical protein ACTHM9_02685 [Gemmatimonadales bacterium]
MTQCSEEIGLVGAEEDGVLARERDRGAPRRGAARRERVERASVGNDDEAKGAGIAPAQARPLGGTIGYTRELDCDRALCGPCDGRDPADLHCDRPGLQQEGER